MIMKMFLLISSSVISMLLRRMLKNHFLTLTSSKSKNIILDPFKSSSKHELMPSISSKIHRIKKYSPGGFSSKWEDNKKNMLKIGLLSAMYQRLSNNNPEEIIETITKIKKINKDKLTSNIQTRKKNTITITIMNTEEDEEIVEEGKIKEQKLMKSLRKFNKNLKNK